MRDEAIIQAALDAGFMICSRCGQERDRAMPSSDVKTLKRFAEIILRVSESAPWPTKNRWYHECPFELGYLYCVQKGQACERCGEKEAANAAE